MEKFTFTQPKTKQCTADYFFIMRRLQGGYQPLWKSVRRLHMTYQCLAEAGLIKYHKEDSNRGFKLTDMGQTYVSYVNSTNTPNKSVIREILKVAKERM
jgi:hypothetical protein